MSTVKAVVFEGPATDTSKTRVSEIALPHPGPGSVAISVSHAGINFKDVMSRRGDPGYITGWPHIPGIEVAGTITELGPGVDAFAPGQPVVAVMNSGGLAEVAIAQAALTVPIPHGLHPAAAAAAPGAFVTAWLLADLSNFTAGDTVLVHSAAGAVGAAIAQIAKLRGVDRLIGTVGNHDRIEAALHHGYDIALVRDEQLLAALTDACPDGINVILDPQGTQMLPIDLDLAAQAGRVIIFGNAPGTPLAALPSLPVLFARNLFIGAFSLQALSTKAPSRVSAALANVLALAANHDLQIHPTVLLGLTAAPGAQQILADGNQAGKYIIETQTPPLVRRQINY
jgi:NADPH2:quinone reductase